MKKSKLEALIKFFILKKFLKNSKFIISFLLLIKENETIKAKVMTKTRDDANKIAELFNGGGHKKEAGFTISSLDVNEIIKKTNDYLKKSHQR